jgi:polyhydroxyalkanoate synthesis repressor PhaR
MPVIKRYTNRKLYNTASKRYITLEEIAILIRQGEEIQVVDNATGEDLTAVTLSQIIMEQEKKRGGFLPSPVLAALVQAGGESLGSLRRNLASPLDLLRQVDEEIERRIQSLVRRGEMEEDLGMRLRDLLSRHLPSDEVVERVLERHEVPTQIEIQELMAQIETLAEKVDELASQEAD